MGQVGPYSVILQFLHHPCEKKSRLKMLLEAGGGYFEGHFSATKYVHLVLITLCLLLVNGNIAGLKWLI